MFHLFPSNRIASVTLLLLLIIQSQVYCQKKYALRKSNKHIATWALKKKYQFGYSSLGISVNSLNYLGDLSPSDGKLSMDLRLTREGIGVSYFSRVGPRLHLGLQYVFGSIEGSDANSNDVYRKQRNLSFRNSIHEISGVVIVDLLKSIKSYRTRVNFTPYIFTGIAIFYHNPQAKAPRQFLNGEINPSYDTWVDLQSLGTEGQYSELQQSDANFGITPYSLLQIGIPLGIGSRLKLTDKMDLWFDMGVRYTFTDYLDDVSGNYVDLNRLRAKSADQTQLAQTLSYRSNEIEQLVSNGTRQYSLTNGSVQLINGYGSEYHTNRRGAPGNDAYMVTSLKVTYIIKPNYFSPKHR